MCVCVCVCVCMCVSTSPSTRAESDTRSIFKQSLIAFNSELSFSKPGRHTKVEKFMFCPTIYSEQMNNNCIHIFHKKICTMGNAVRSWI